MDSPSFDLQEVKRVLEAALLTSAEPLQLNDLKKLFDEDLSNDVLRNILTELAAIGTGAASSSSTSRAAAFSRASRVHEISDRLNPQRPPRYSRAVMETLAIIAYKQPVTRGDIEDIRGLSCRQHHQGLAGARVIDVVGIARCRRTELFATTRQFLTIWRCAR